MPETKVFGDALKAKVLVIGHDPRLQSSDSIAEYCFFADHFFRPIPSRRSDLAKYQLAESLFSYIGWLTSYRYRADEYVITNLCNEALTPAPKGKTVFIPESEARRGLKHINDILTGRQFGLIIAMSPQVNYWLQKLGFYFSTDNYLEQSEPREKAAQMGYYEPIGKSPFLEICGNEYFVGKIPLFPVLHVKQYPLTGFIKSNYGNAYRKCINSIKALGFQEGKEAKQ